MDSLDIVQSESLLTALISAGCVGGMVTLASNVTKGSVAGVLGGVLAGTAVQYKIDKLRTEESVELSMKEVVHQMMNSRYLAGEVPEYSSEEVESESNKYLSRALLNSLVSLMGIGAHLAIGMYLPTPAQLMIQPLIEQAAGRIPGGPVLPMFFANLARGNYLGAIVPLVFSQSTASLYGSHVPQPPSVETGGTAPEEGPQLPAIPDVSQNLPAYNVAGISMLGLMQMGLGLMVPGADEQSKNLAMNAIRMCLDNADVLSLLASIATEGRSDVDGAIQDVIDNFLEHVGAIFGAILPGVRTHSHNIVIIQGRDNMSYAMLTPFQGQAQVAIPIIQLPMETWMVVEESARRNNLDPQILPTNIVQRAVAPRPRDSTATATAVSLTTAKSQPFSLRNYDDAGVFSRFGTTQEEVDNALVQARSMFQVLATITTGGVPQNVIAFDLFEQEAFLFSNILQTFTSQSVNFAALGASGESGSPLTSNSGFGDLQFGDYVRWDIPSMSPELRAVHQAQPLGIILGESEDSAVVIVGNPQTNQVLAVRREFIVRVDKEGRPVESDSESDGPRPGPGSPDDGEHKGEEDDSHPSLAPTTGPTTAPSTGPETAPSTGPAKAPSSAPSATKQDFVYELSDFESTGFPWRKQITIDNEEHQRMINELSKLDHESYTWLQDHLSPAYPGYTEKLAADAIEWMFRYFGDFEARLVKTFEKSKKITQVKLPEEGVFEDFDEQGVVIQSAKTNVFWYYPPLYNVQNDEIRSIRTVVTGKVTEYRDGRQKYTPRIEVDTSGTMSADPATQWTVGGVAGNVAGVLGARIGARVLAQPITGFSPTMIGQLTKAQRMMNSWDYAVRYTLDDIDAPLYSRWDDPESIAKWFETGEGKGPIGDLTAGELAETAGIDGLGGFIPEMAGNPMTGAALSMYSMEAQMDFADMHRTAGEPDTYYEDHSLWDTAEKEILKEMDEGVVILAKKKAAQEDGL